LELWLDALFNAQIFWGILLIAFRLLLIFNNAKEKFALEDTEEVDVTERIRKPANGLMKYLKFWRNYDLISDKNMAIMFCVMEFIWLLIPGGYSIYAYISGDFDACDNLHLAEDLAVSCIGAIAGVALAILLRSAHDAYWMKNELKSIGIFCCVVLVPQLSIGFAGLIPYYWFEWIGLFEFVVIAFILYTIPAILVLQERYQGHDMSTLSSATSYQFKEDTELEAVETHGFGNNAKIARIVGDPNASKYIEECQVHYQLLEMSDLFLFWQKLQKFRTADQKSLAGHAILIYQKYLKPDAYIQLQIFTPEQIKPFEELNTKSAEGSDTDVGWEIFEELARTTEHVLCERFFPIFFQSKYYELYQEKIRLSKGLREK